MFTNTTSHHREVIDCLRNVVHGVVYRVEVAPRDEVGGKKRRELSMTRKAIKAREKRKIQREAKEREKDPLKYDQEEAVRNEREAEDVKEAEEKQQQMNSVKPLLEIPQTTQELFANLETKAEEIPVVDFDETYSDVVNRFQIITMQRDPDFGKIAPQIEIDPNAIYLNVAEKETYFDGILENYQRVFDRVKSVTDDAASLAQSESGTYVSAQEKILLMKKLLFDSENLKVLCKEKMKSFASPASQRREYDVIGFLDSENYGIVEPSIPFVKHLPSIPPDPVIFEDPSRQNLPMVPPDFDCEGGAHLVGSVLPSDFPKQLSFRALSCYSLIRTLSLRLHISPFTPCAFLRSLSLPFPTRLLGEIHVSILRYLFANIGLGKYYNRGNNGAVQLKAMASENIKLDLMARGGDNLSYMDAFSWPLFFEDYAFITAERLMLAEEDGEDSGYEDDEIKDKKASNKSKNKRSLDADPVSDSSTSFPADDNESSDEENTDTGEKASTSVPKSRKRPKYDDENNNKKQNGRPTKKRYILQRTPVKKMPLVTSSVGKRRGRPAKGHATILAEGEQASTLQFLTASSKKAPLTHVVLMKDIIDNVALFENHPHLNVIKLLRQGHEYHKLSVEQKLDVLEFLLDELIQIDLFISELNFRFNKTQKFPGIFGPLPTDNELANLSNVDQCVVCGLEGELICCDGCTSSYHRKCIGLPAEGDLPPGKWLCVECKVVDPIKLGPLRGGSKPALEWHSRRDLANIYKNPSFINIGSQANYPNTPGDMDVYGQSLTNVKRSADEQYLIIHGYVFNRKSPIDTMSPPVAFSQSDLFDLLRDLGPDICLKWPWCQVPFNSKQVWKDSIRKKFPSINRDGFTGADAKQNEYFGNYFITPVSHNPTVYYNLYRQAPLPGFISTQTAPSFSFPQEDLFNIYATFKMNPDMNSDDSLNKKNYDFLYPFKDFLLRMEREMYRACLLHELWGINRKLITDPWSTNVYKCQSVQKLAEHTVKLVDAIHSRAFHDEWNLLTNMKASEHKLHRSYEDMAMDWTSEVELRRRKWERTPIVKSVRLMIEEGHLTSHRRKGAKSCGRKRKNLSAVVHLPRKDNDSALVDENGASTNQTNNGYTQQTPSVTPMQTSSLSSIGSRRRSGRVQSRNAVHIGIETLVSDVMPYTMSSVPDTSNSYLDIYSNKLQTRINLLEKLVSEPFEKEQAWAHCGRKLYVPQGRMSPSVMKYLGRNAGSVYAPHIVYSDKHEVGQPCVSHVWRQNTLKCTTVEELSLQLRIVDSYLNRSAISTCESFARRVSTGKESVLKLVKCIHRDPSTGLLEYYVVQRGKRRGCWFSEESIDLSALIMDRAIRIEAHRTKFFNLISERRISHEMHDKATVAAESAAKTLKESQQLFTEKSVTAKKAIELSELLAKDYQYARTLLQQAQEKAVEAKGAANSERAEYEKKLRLEREAASKAAEAEAKARAKAEAKARTQAEAKAKSEALAKAKAEAATKAQAVKAKAEAEKRKKMLEERRRKDDILKQRARAEEERRNDAILVANREQESRVMEQSRKEAQEQKHFNDYEEIVHNHSLKTKQLLHESSFLGQATVPSDKMQFARQKTMAELKDINNTLRSLGMKAYEDPKLIADLASAEQVGMSMFVKEIGTEGQDDEEEEDEDAYVKSEAKTRIQQKMKNKSVASQDATAGQRTRRVEDVNLVDQDDPSSPYENAVRQQKQAGTPQSFSSTNIAARAAAQSAGSSAVDTDAVLKAMGQHAIQQHLLNNLNIQRQEEPNNPNVLNFPSGYTDSENIQNALQQNLLAQSEQGGGANISQLYAGYNLGNQAFQLPSDQLNELQVQAQAMQGNILNPAAYQYAAAGRQLGGDFQLAQAYDPNSAQFVNQAALQQQLDLSQQQVYSQLPNQQQPQFLQVARQQQNPSSNSRQYKPGGFDFGHF